MPKPRYYLLLFGTALADVFLLWMGWYLLIHDNRLTSTGLVLAGIGAMLGVVFVLSASVPKRFQIATGLFFLSLYFFMRADGLLEWHILSSIIALASWAAAALLAYIVTIRMNPDKADAAADGQPP